MGRTPKYKTLKEHREAHRLRVAKWRADHPEKWKEIQDKAYRRRRAKRQRTSRARDMKASLIDVNEGSPVVHYIDQPRVKAD
jgi:hypothetical protein